MLRAKIRKESAEWLCMPRGRLLAFRANTQVFTIHESVVVLGSSYFRDFIQRRKNPAKSVIKLEDVDPHHLGLYFSYCYMSLTIRAACGEGYSFCEAVRSSTDNRDEKIISNAVAVWLLSDRFKNHIIKQIMAFRIVDTINAIAKLFDCFDELEPDFVESLVRIVVDGFTALCETDAVIETFGSLRESLIILFATGPPQDQWDEYKDLLEIHPEFLLAVQTFAKETLDVEEAKEMRAQNVERTAQQLRWIEEDLVKLAQEQMEEDI